MIATMTATIRDFFQRVSCDFPYCRVRKSSIYIYIHIYDFILRRARIILSDTTVWKTRG